MGRSEIHDETFEVGVFLNESQKTVSVKPEETTDGAEYFNCRQSGETITQIRQDKDGSWDQIWGTLDNETVQAIGKAISKHTR